MKSTMKSAFAFIAVALMIMVAVVPMVGVFTEDSSADAVAIPGTGKITVSGTVKNGSDTAIENALVKIEANSKLVGYGVTDSSGEYSIDLYIDDKLTFKVSVVTDAATYVSYMGAGAVNPAASYKFAEQTFTDVKADVEKIENVNFKDGNVTISGQLYYKNDKEFVKSTSVTAKYKVGSTEKTASATTDKEGKYAILVPVGVKVIVSATDFVSSEETEVTSNTTVDLKNGKLNLGTVTTTVPELFKDLEIKLTMTKKGTNVEKLEVLDSGKVVDGKAMFEYSIKADATDKLDIEIKDSLNLGKVQNVNISESVSYNFNAYIYGAIKMGGVDVLAATVSIDTYKLDAEGKEIEVASISGAELIGNTYYAAFGAATISDDVKKIKVTVDANGNKKISDSVDFTKDSEVTNVDVNLETEGYNLITVNVKKGTDAVSGVEVVLDKDAIGAVSKKLTTDSNGDAKFYVKTGSVIKITPTGTFDVKDRTFTVMGDTEVAFKIDAIELSGSAIKDAADKVITGVTVNYKVPGATEYSTVTSDKNGYKITVNSNVKAEDVKVYFAKEKYTFDAKDDETAIAMSAATAIKAKEQTYTFTLADAKGVAIKDLTGITVSVAKYKIHTAGSSVVYDGTDGTAITPVNDVYSFIGSSDYVGKTGEYRESYCVKVTTSDATSYTFDAITEYKANLTIKAKEQTFTGKVVDAATSDAKELKGMTVAVYDTDGKTKLSKDVTTLNDGSFSVISKSGTLKAVDPNGVYTFEEGVADTSTGVYTIKANEQTYSGEVKDADNKLVKNAKITVKVVDADGKTIGSVATVGKDGKYSIITKLTAGNKVVATDADAKRTFKDVVIGTSAMVIPDVVSGQYTLSGTVKEMTSNKAIKDITVTLSTYSATVDPVLVSTAVTNEKGEYSFFVNEKAGYGVVATSSGNYIFSEGKMSFTDHVANIVTKYAISEGTVEEVTGGKVLSGIKVTAYGVDDVVVGEYVTDKVGKFKYPAIVNESGVSLIKFKAVDPNGAYTFADGLTSDDIKAKEKTVTVTIKADDGSTDKLPLAGVTVNFLKGEKVVKTATTDAKGKASVIIAPSAYDKVKAVDGNTAYGAMTFDSILTTDGMIYADQTVYSGFYANGDVVSGVVVTYEMSKGDAYVEKGKAVVIDNKYYIASAATAADKIVITANAQGFYAVNTFNSLTSIGTSDLKIKEKPGIVKVDEDDVLFGEFYTVYNATNAQVGDKIILRASEVAYAPLEDGNETTVVKYKFNGWYVNGVKVSDDLEYVYTVTESCLVYADYKASTYETASDDNGISPSVLVIGIAAVIVALIAVVYTVIQKKE
ncbi:hypothetical protein [Candidatus Methanarcanum hacksteinii]|uniref:hypothetical protein n=1 Tax=Candidatus Methanarcanum hacksteinii TaxID=2911857 RepID=UPI0037DDC7B7